MARADRQIAVGSEHFGLGIALFGLRDVERALKQVAPELAKQMDREIRGELEPIAAAARSQVPTVALSGWDADGAGEWSTRLGWDPAKVAKGIKVAKGGSTSRATRATGARIAYRVVNKSAAGAVFELAGRNNPGSAFNAVLASGHGRASRLIWRAWDRTSGKDKIAERVTTAVERAEAELTRLVDGAG